MPSLTARQADQLRLRAQHLEPRSTGSVGDVVAATVGIQAQDVSAAALSIGVRHRHLTFAGVQRAVAEERSVVRTWLMRGTLHLVPTDDLGWLLLLFGPLLMARGARRRAELGLDADTCERGVRLLRQALANGPLTRAEIVQRLAERGLALEGQARIHLLAYAAHQGVVLYGADRGRDSTFVLLDDWSGSATSLDRDAALAELARRYLTAFGPATPEDLAVWSGLSMRDVRAGWGALADLREVIVDGRSAWLLGDPHRTTDTPIVRLLPAFDTYLLGYRVRPVEAEHAGKVNRGGGMIAPTVLVDGRVAGTWRLERKRGRLAVVSDLFRPLPDRVAAIEEEAAHALRFLAGAAPDDLVSPLDAGQA